MPALATTSVAAPRRDSLGVIAAAVVGAAAWILPLGKAWSTSPDLGHGWAVPALIAYLLWERWGERPPARPAPPAAARWLLLPVLLVLHLGLRLFLTPFPLWPAALLAYTLLIAGTALFGAWLLAGWAGVRWLAPPLILVASALPLPSALELEAIRPVRETLASLAAEACDAFGIPAVASGTTVSLASSVIGIDEACGGIRSLQACFMIGLFFGEWYRFGWLRRAGLVLAGVAAALVGNFGRVLFLAFRAAQGEQAVESAHDGAGWTAMLASLVLTGLLAWLWAGRRGPPTPARRPRPAAQPPLPWRWMLAAACLIIVDEAAVRTWYAKAAHALNGRARWTAQFPTELGTYRTAPLANLSREMLQPDFYQAGRWRSESDLAVSAYYIEWRRGQAARYVPFLHNPTVCMPMAGMELVSEEPGITLHWPGGDIPFHAYRFSYRGSDLLVAFTVWDPLRGAPLVQAEKTGSWSDFLSQRWAEVRSGRENQPAQLLSVAVPWSEGGRSLMEQWLEKLVATAP